MSKTVTPAARLLAVEVGRKIALPGIREDDHHQTAVQPPGQLQCPGHGRAGAHARKDALFARQQAAGLEGDLVLHVQNLVQGVLVVDARRVGFEHVLEALYPVARIGFHGGHVDRAHLVQPLGDAHGRARGAQRHDAVGHRAPGLVPDFEPGAHVVCLDRGRIVVLVHEHVLVRLLAGVAVRLLDGPVRGQVAGGQLQLRAVGGHDHLALLAGRLRHEQLDAVALDGRDHGQPHAGIAGGGLDDDLVPGQLARFLRRRDHGRGHPILDGAAGILALDLGQNPDVGIGIQMANFHQRRVADQFKQVFIHRSALESCGLGWDRCPHPRANSPGAQLACNVQTTAETVHFLSTRGMP